MKERPILFSSPMVRALLDGSKTQTRRIVTDESLISLRPDGTPGKVQPRCKFGQPGDRLWVREAWKAHTTFDHLPPRDIPNTHVWYMADAGYKAESRYRQGMFMPRWASRILLEIVSVRVERLQDISEADAIAEGIEPLYGAWRDYQTQPSINHRPTWSTAIGSYRSLWESLNGPGSWAANLWVWVVEFKRVAK